MRLRLVYKKIDQHQDNDWHAEQPSDQIFTHRHLLMS